jgi:hypothetical protein
MVLDSSGSCDGERRMAVGSALGECGQTKAGGANGRLECRRLASAAVQGAPLANATGLLVGDAGTNAREVPGHCLDNTSRIPI